MVIVLHEVDTLARDSMCDDHAWLFVIARAILPHRSRSRRCAVDFLHMPAEAFPFAAQVLKRHDVFGIAVDLDVVAIDKDDELAELVLAGKHRRFPDIAFIQFAVTRDDIDKAMLGYGR